VKYFSSGDGTASPFGVTFLVPAASFTGDAGLPLHRDARPVKGATMTRLPTHTMLDAPEASRPLLEGTVQFSPTGNLLNLHAQMAHSPAVLAAYVSLRQATGAHGTLDPRTRPALMVAAAGAVGNAYAETITSALARRAGWSPAEVLALRDGRSVDDEKTDALAAVVREATGDAGRVSDLTWERAVAAGWDSGQLAEAFAYLGLTVFTAYFLNYAQTPADLGADVAGAVAAGGRD
jgi:alkylhydroperoxidase family enzyme